MRKFWIILLVSTLIVPGCGGGDGEGGDGHGVETQPPTSLLLVTIDTLRADRLGCYGYGRAETPSIDALARGGVLFESVFSTAPITLPSHTSLLTGTLPPFHGVRDNGTAQVAQEVVTLAELMAPAGWRCAAFTAAFVLDSQFGLDQGFEAYGNVPQREMTLGIGVEDRPAREVNAQAFAWLEGLDSDEPFFMWVHYFEPHRPYPPNAQIPAHLRQRPYDAEVKSADTALGELLAQLEKQGRADETLVVLTADHGESLGEHGESTHSFFVYQGVLHIPLIFNHASLPHGMRVEQWVSLVDVLPTVLELLGLEAHDTPPPSRSLAGFLRGEVPASAPIYFESLSSLQNYGWAPIRGIAHGGYKLIDLPRGELYELADDPAEEVNLHAKEGQTASSLKEALARLLEANLRPESFGSAQRNLSAEERARLANLGYAGGSTRREEASDLADPKDRFERVQKEEQAFIHFQQGQLQKAEAIVRELLEDDPENGVFHSHMGSLLIQRQEFRSALPHLEQSLRGGFRTADVMSNLGTCKLATGDPRGAEGAFRTALKINPKHLLSMLNLADLLAQEERKAEARIFLESFLSLWKGDPELTRQVRAQLQALGS